MQLVPECVTLLIGLAPLMNPGMGEMWRRKKKCLCEGVSTGGLEGGTAIK